jgi:hypothetical protein
MDLMPTRRALHGVAELLLAGPQYRTAGTIRLLVTGSGFRALKQPDIRVDGVDLVVAGQRFPIAGHTCAHLATAAGIEPGAPQGLYHDGSGVALDEPLHLDPEAARWLARCWADGDQALRTLAPDQQPILWPEHFDVGIRTEDTNYGVSPGDTYLPEPYAYITPPAPREGGFWNAPFGAARPMADLDGPDALLAFFREARTRKETA